MEQKKCQGSQLSWHSDEQSSNIGKPTHIQGATHKKEEIPAVVTPARKWTDQKQGTRKNYIQETTSARVDNAPLDTISATTHKDESAATYRR